LLLGRRTFEEMTGWFRGHRPLVLTRRALPSPWEDAGVSGVEESIRRVAEGGGESLWVCGGASVYEAAMAHADELILTEVRARLGEGVPFPVFDADEWCEVRREVSAGGAEPKFERVWRVRVRKEAGNGQCDV